MNWEEMGFCDWYDYQFYMETGRLPGGYVWIDSERVEYVG